MSEPVTYGQRFYMTEIRSLCFSIYVVPGKSVRASAYVREGTQKVDEIEIDIPRLQDDVYLETMRLVEHFRVKNRRDKYGIQRMLGGCLRALIREGL